MPVTEKKTVYRTSDGREFESRVEAERHDKLDEARRAFQAAQEAFGRALALTHRTADGELFEIGLWRKYRRVVGGYGSMPRLESLDSFWGRPAFEFDDRAAEIEIVEPNHGQKPRSRRCVISELYAHEKTALRALLKAQEEWLADRVAEVEHTRKLVTADG